MSLTFALERIPFVIGAIFIVTDEEERVRALDWEDHKARMLHLLSLQYAQTVRLIRLTGSSPARGALERYFDGDLQSIEPVRTQTSGTQFQRRVWASLRKIPAGRTVTYGELAQRLNHPRAIRAVGAANGANPISIFVPCHRVIGANGLLTGYGGGVERKRWLLQHEGLSVSASGRVYDA